jgi:hypothetical protein
MKKDAVGATLDKMAELERKKEKRALPKVRERRDGICVSFVRVLLLL